MGKIKLNLVSGAVVEKPLINAFRANNFEYVILDNEMNGSMGLPIILVCKLENGKLIKIEDQNEWQVVKEYLKNIIAGSEVELVKVPNVLPANDIYYTQLTLPLPSFDALKKAYTIAGSENESSESVAAATNPSPVPVSEQPVMETPVAPETQNVATTPTPDVTSNVPTDVAPGNVNPVEGAPVQQVDITPNISEASQPTNNEASVEATPVVDLGISNVPVMDNSAQDTAIDLNAPIPVFGDVNIAATPTPDEAPIAPALESTPQVDVTPDIPVTPVVDQPTLAENEPVVSIAPDTENESPFKEQKEAFMQACENMFDALVQKFEKELENKQ